MTHEDREFFVKCYRKYKLPFNDYKEEQEEEQEEQETNLFSQMEKILHYIFVYVTLSYLLQIVYLVRFDVLTVLFVYLIKWVFDPRHTVAIRHPVLCLITLIPWPVVLTYWAWERTTWDYWILGAFVCTSMASFVLFQCIRFHHRWKCFHTVWMYIAPISHLFSKEDVCLQFHPQMERVLFESIPTWYTSDMGGEIHHIGQFENIFQIHKARKVWYFLLDETNQLQFLFEKYKHCFAPYEQDDTCSVYVDFRPFMKQQLMQQTLLPEVLVDLINFY